MSEDLPYVAGDLLSVAEYPPYGAKDPPYVAENLPSYLVGIISNLPCGLRSSSRVSFGATGLRSGPMTRGESSTETYSVGILGEIILLPRISVANSMGLTGA